MKKAYLSLIGICLVASSCQRVVSNVDLPTIERKTVAQAGISNLSDFHVVTLTKSNPIFNSRAGDFEVVEGASVIIEGENVRDSFTFSDELEKYTAPNQNTFVVGEEYRLLVKTPDGKELSGVAYMPKKPLNVNATLDSTVDGDETLFEYEITWDRTATTDDYYMVEVMAIYKFDNTLDTTSWYVNRPYIKGEDSDQTTLKRKGSFREFSGPFFETDLHKLIYVVSGITKEHYEYGQFLYDYDPENPFSEPVSIPTNIQNGLGMFVLKNSVQVE
ncbi:MAG: DUF4249 family protein [Bacteroidia bacterium]|nr:DUF4249 family protein [Bacteroidia bacterium]